MENRREANRSGSEELDHLEDKVKVDEEEEAVPVEKIFEDGEVPTWRKQLTLRGMAVSFVLSVVFSFTAIKLNLTTGIIPSSTVSARLLGFFFVKIWNQSRMLKQPFTPQENTVIQTCVVAASGIAFSGGFGSYLFGMSERIAKQSAEIKGNHDYKNPSLGWMIGFLFLVSFVGLFSMVPLRKIMIIDFKLTYPSGTAVGHLINNFHTREGFELAKKPVRELGKFFSFSFLWGFFQWFFTAGEKCGFGSFPMFGLKAYEHRFLFDFSATFIGIGMICPHIINISVLVGGILSWGIMWPLIGTKKGDWYSAELDPHSLQGLQGYKIFLGAAMILGDGLYNFFKVLIRTLAGLLTFMQHKNATKRLPVADNHLTPVSPPLSFDDQRQTHLFLKDQIPPFFAIGGYIVIAAISTATIPHIFHQLKWYYVMVIYIFAPIMGFCNAFGCGLTDWNYSSTYGKLAIFLIGAWAGASHGGVLAGLAACGVMMNIVTTACDLTKDFKTGYLTLTSPRSMFVSQVIGTAMGCVISPCVFWIFYKAFPDLGLPQSKYPAPFALIYRNMAVLGVEGFSTLPKNCLLLCCVFFAAAILMNLVRDALGKERAWFIPLPMAMAIPFYLGSYFAIDMCIGCLILFIWGKVNKADADACGPVVASGLICGDSVWTFPESILALAGVKPPICMKFLSRGTNRRVDKFLKPLG